MIFTWGTRERPLRAWPHASCECGHNGWVLFIRYPYFTLLWIFGACTARSYVLVCVSCGRRVVPTQNNAQIEAEVGNSVPFKYRYGLAMLVTAILIGAAYGTATTSGGADSSSSSTGSSALSLLGFLAFVALIGFLLFFGHQSAADAKNPEGEKLVPPALRKPSMSAGLSAMLVKNAPSGLSGLMTKSAPASVPEQIRELAELRDRNVLTEAEFQAKKTELLGRI